MTQDQIDRIRAYCEKATPGPWYLNGYRSSISQQNPAEKPDKSKRAILLIYPCLEAVAKPDLDFIANARSDLPLLLQQVEQLGADAAIGTAWRLDNSLEKWFPFTAEELERLRKDKDRLDWLLGNRKCSTTLSGQGTEWITTREQVDRLHPTSKPA